MMPVQNLFSKNLTCLNFTTRSVHVLIQKLYLSLKSENVFMRNNQITARTLGMQTSVIDHYVEGIFGSLQFSV